MSEHPRIEIGGLPTDVEMRGEDETPEVQQEVENGNGDEMEEDAPAAEDPEKGTKPSQANKFLEYLKSPIIQLVVGEGEEQTTLSAHEAILTTSPYFAEAVEKLGDKEPRRISLLNESVETVSSFLQYQYTGEYFPKRLPSSADGLETDPSIPDIDDTGEQLLRHARIYTLAQKLGLDDLKLLAHSKIHRINSTAKGEIAYARYVYANSQPGDTTIRKPVAAFWATRSHVLRHEAEEEFRSMCLEFPQFGFDVLSLVLDQREKRAHHQDVAVSTPVGKGSARKRARMGL